MKTLLLLLMIGLAAPAFSQNKVALPHGMVFGQKPDTGNHLPAQKLEAFMGKKTRISTTIAATITHITKTKGGWFEVDAGNGKVIAAHFADYSVTLPIQLKGRKVLIEGVAQKRFIADDLQHFAGDTVNGKKQHQDKTNPKRRLTFEVKGLMVD